MPCYHPLLGYRSKTVNKSGKRGIVFDTNEGFLDMPVQVKCGRCIGCRLERSRQWAIRCMHESQLYERNCFITLTYRDSSLPDDNSLVMKHFQDFMKRLRKQFGKGIRFFHCGEYGDKFQRPHYHACLFNFDFEDKVFWTTKHGYDLYVSPSLNRLWPFGYSTIGDVTFESAAYVARYITKKISGEKSDMHYLNKDTGVIRSPEYVTMSRRPGIAAKWFEKYKGDVYPSDSVVVRGKYMLPPKFYDSMFDLEDPSEMKRIKLIRQKKFAKDISSDRLLVKEQRKLLDIKKLKRGFEDGND